MKTSVSVSPPLPPAARFLAGLLPLLAGLLLSGCATGLAHYPLADTQKAVLVSRAAPRTDLQAAVPGMSTAWISVPVETPVEQAWQELAVRFGDIHKWSGPIADSSCNSSGGDGHWGATRSCTFGPAAPVGVGKSIFETVRGWDADRHYFEVEVDRSFFPMQQAVQEYWIEPTPTGSRVTTALHFKVTPPLGVMVRLPKMRRAMVQSILGFKHFVETGDATKAKDIPYVTAHYPDVFTANGL